MLRNYLRIALRSILKNKVYSGLNIFGLSFGMAFCILSFTYIYNELNYNTFHRNYNSIYRITTEIFGKDGKLIWARGESPDPMGEIIKNRFPEVQKVIKVIGQSSRIKYQDKCFFEKKGYKVEKSFLEVFDFPILKGDWNTALTEPNSILLSEKLSKKYFAEEEAIGKLISVDQNDYIVKGIYADVPENSDIKFDFLLSAGPPVDKNLSDMSGWMNHFSAHFILASPDFNRSDFENKINAIVNNYLGESEMGMFAFHLQNFSDLHLNSNFDPKTEYKSEKNLILIFSLIAVFLLFIACINFINISIGLASARIKEVGVRKVIGATRIQIIRQFSIEIILECFFALLFSLVLTELFIPAFNKLINKDLHIVYNYKLLVFLFLLAVITGVLSGGITAFIISKQKPVDILKTKFKIGGFNLFNKLLVIFQFSLSIFFIITGFVISRQINYIKEKDLGYDKKDLLVVPVMNWDNPDENVKLLNNLRSELYAYPEFLNITGGSYNINNSYGAIGSSDLNIKGSEIGYCYYGIDYNYLNTFRIKLLRGRNFENNVYDEKNSLIINESFEKMLNTKDAIGMKIGKKTIIGVTLDFHYESLHSKLNPLSLELNGIYTAYIFIRIQPDKLEKALEMLKSKWKIISPDLPFDYSFLDEEINLNYQSEMNLSKAINYSSILVLLISSLGILGLTGLSINRQRKEISIRKIFGASANNIVSYLMKKYVILILISNVLAWPAAYYFLNSWLQNYEYRISINLLFFFLAGLFTILVTLSVISYQTVKASLENPVIPLKNE